MLYEVVWYIQRAGPARYEYARAVVVKTQVCVAGRACNSRGRGRVTRVDAHMMGKVQVRDWNYFFCLFA